jgi:signal transduction histidine kinase/ActR/RegA family two-component response regulator
LTIRKLDPGTRALREAISASLAQTAWLVAGLYGLLAVIHPFALSGEHRWSMCLVAAISSLLSAATAFWWRKNPQPNQAHLVSALLASIPLINTVLHFALFQQAVNTTNFVILILASGLVMLSRVSFYTVVTLALISWATIVSRFNVPESSEWGWFLFFAAFSGGILEEQRIHATRASGLRAELLLQRNEALQNLVKTPALSDTNVTHVLGLIAEAARINLAASTVTIWLPEGENHELRAVASNREGVMDTNAPKNQVLTISEEFTQLLFENRTVPSNRHAASLSDEEGTDKEGRGQPTLYVGIVSSRHLVGLILVEREDINAAWTLEDQMFAASIADLANLALQTRQRIVLEGQARKAEHLESLGVLAGGVAHDFNNLLTVILGNIELMQQAQTVSGETQTSLESMMEAGIRARDLAQQMLAYAGRAHRQTQTLDLASFGSEIDRVWAHDLLDGIDVAFEIDQTKVLAVDVDPTQMRQVILNLLTNARDSGASRITISVGTESALKLTGLDPTLENSGYHWLEVEDNGSGMRASEIERIFEPFYTTRKTGTGLGLAASLGIMRAHLGALTVESTLGQGSRFRLLVPCSSKKPETISTKATGELESLSERTKVLLIEDEPLVARLATAMLEQSGRQVQSLDSLGAFQESLPSINLDELEFALIDLTLGDGSGLDAATLARKRRPDLPVILVSGYDARNVLQDQRLADSVEFLSKPFSLGNLQAAIDKAIALLEKSSSPTQE